VAGIIQEALCF